MLFEAGIAIDNENITDQGRGPIAVDRDERSVMVELADGTRYRYIKKIAKTYALSWENLVGAEANTIDNNVGRDWLHDNVGTVGETHTVTFRHIDGDREVVTAYVTGYHEELVMRREDDFFWNVTVTLEEV